MLFLVAGTFPRWPRLEVLRGDFSSPRLHLKFLANFVTVALSGVSLLVVTSCVSSVAVRSSFSTFAHSGRAALFILIFQCVCLPICLSSWEVCHALT